MKKNITIALLTMAILAMPVLLASNITSSVSSGGSGTPGGSNTQIQYNNSGSFGGITGATTDGTTLSLVAPILGTPASGTLTNCTIPFNKLSTGTNATGTFTVGTGASLTFSGSGTVNASQVGGTSIGTPT